MEKFQEQRDLASYTLNNSDLQTELNSAKGSIESDKIYHKELKKVLEDTRFTLSGITNNKNRNEVLPQGDLDGESSLFLFRLAGINIKPENLNFIHSGKTAENSIVLDTGNEFGVKYDKDINSLIIDHHKKVSNDKISSTAEITADLLIKEGLLEDTKQLRNFVNFITKEDNFIKEHSDFLISDKTIAGLRRDISIEKLYEYFENHDSATEVLDSEELVKYGVSEEIINKQRNFINEDTDAIANIEERGDIIRSEKLGNIVINKDREIQTGASAVYAYGYDGVLNIGANSFMLNFKDPNMTEEILKEYFGENFPGLVIRNKMWKVENMKNENIDLDDIKKILENNE
jgi:hypothetical protein